MIFGIILLVIGVASVVEGILVIMKIVKTSEDKATTRSYVSVKFITAGIGAIALGLAFFFDK